MSRSSLYVLYITSHQVSVYYAKSDKIILIETFDIQSPAVVLARLAQQHPKTPWALLVDQSEESFWGDVMPILRGAAKKAWIARLSTQFENGSPYRCMQIQGKSRSEPDKLYVLGYTIGRPDAIAPWLNALQTAHARIRGMYAPSMLVDEALKILKIKLPKDASTICVLATPCANGLRQTVLQGGRVRFSRLVSNTDARGSHWLELVYKESARLHEYLINNQLLPNDHTGMSYYVVQPQNTSTRIDSARYPAPHPNDHYTWIKSPQPLQLFLQALARSQPWTQLAPPEYRRNDQTMQACFAMYIICFLMSAIVAFVVIFGGAQLWEKYSATEISVRGTRLITQQYQTLAKTFTQTPLTSTQMLEMRKRWEALNANPPASMRDMLMVAGLTLERHTHMRIEELMWDADVNESGAIPHSFNKEKKEVSALTLRGSIHGISSDDLRGTRDALVKLEQDFNRHTKIRAEITKQPLDLSAKASVTGSGTQDKTEVSFEIKLWSR